MATLVAGRDRRIALVLASGESTQATARRFRLTQAELASYDENWNAHGTISSRKHCPQACRAWRPRSSRSDGLDAACYPLIPRNVRKGISGRDITRFFLMKHWLLPYPSWPNGPAHAGTFALLPERGARRLYLKPAGAAFEARDERKKIASNYGMSITSSFLHAFLLAVVFSRRRTTSGRSAGGNRTLNQKEKSDCPSCVSFSDPSEHNEKSTGYTS